MSPVKPLLKDLNSFLMCPLCCGYIIDAVTLTECFHIFCKACIVSTLETRGHKCPLCEKAIQFPDDMRRDTVFQELVYKLVSGLRESERARMIRFYSTAEAALPAKDSAYVQILAEPLTTTSGVNDQPPQYRFLSFPVRTHVAVVMKQLKQSLRLPHFPVLYRGDTQLRPEISLDTLISEMRFRKDFDIRNPIKLYYRVRERHLSKPKRQRNNIKVTKD